jgi:hypothetical protein
MFLSLSVHLHIFLSPYVSLNFTLSLLLSLSPTPSLSYSISTNSSFLSFYVPSLHVPLSLSLSHNTLCALSLYVPLSLSLPDLNIDLHTHTILFILLILLFLSHTPPSLSCYFLLPPSPTPSNMTHTNHISIRTHILSHFLFLSFVLLPISPSLF